MYNIHKCVYIYIYVYIHKQIYHFCNTVQNLFSHSKLLIWGNKQKKKEIKYQELQVFDTRHTLGLTASPR